MATSRATTTTTVVAPSAAERIRAYRDAAKALAPASAAPVGTTTAETFGKLGSDFVSFFGDVSAVYKVERASRL